jgi:hypothetical protein
MPEESDPLVRLPGSERAPLAAATPAGQLDTSERAELTLVLRRRAELPAGIVEGPTVLTSEQLAEQYGADPADVDLVRRTLTGLGLEITAVHPASRRIKVAGTLGQLSSVFGAELRQVSSPAPSGHGTVTHRYRQGPLFVPAPLDGVVLAVLGLDDRPQARPHFRARDAAAAHGHTYPPNQVADIYQFPAGTTGAGQTVAVIELGGGYSDSDLDTYFGGLGIPVPSITAVGVDGASNDPGSDPNGADVEVALDIDVIGAAAPGAAQLVYFAPNSDSGFIDADPDAPVCRGGARCQHGGLPRHHQGEQRSLHGRPGLGRLLGPRQPRRHRAAEPAPGLASAPRWCGGRRPGPRYDASAECPSPAPQHSPSAKSTCGPGWPFGSSQPIGRPSARPAHRGGMLVWSCSQHDQLSMQPEPSR